MLHIQKSIRSCVSDLTDRYMSDRHLPDKAIDALDEAGSRVHINNINVPNNILNLENDLENIREEKNSVVKRQKFEEAAKLRDKERQIELNLKMQNQFGKKNSNLKKNRVSVDENVADVVSMMTGVSQ